MAYVSVPKDLTKVKNKIAFNLTRRQIICLGIAGAIGIPFYFLTRKWIGNEGAMMGMVVLMIPAFLFAMYEKDGMPLEKVLMNMITVKYKRPHVRHYETENHYGRQGAEASVPSVPGGRHPKNEGVPAPFKNDNYGKSMDARRREEHDEWREPEISRRNAEASIHAAQQRGGMRRARQG